MLGAFFELVDEGWGYAGYREEEYTEYCGDFEDFDEDYYGMWYLWEEWRGLWFYFEGGYIVCALDYEFEFWF